MEHETVPLQNGDSKEGHEVDSAVTKSDKRTWKDTCRVLTIFSLLLFLPLNIAQICVIYMYDGWELYIFAPFLVFAIGLAGVAWALRREYATFRSVFSDVLSRRWSTVKRKMKGSNRSGKFGIIITVFLNFILLELYVRIFAVPAAKEKVWVTTMDFHESLPSPAVILSQDTAIGGNAVLVQDENQLQELNDKLTDPSEPTHYPGQRAFVNFTSIPIAGGDLNRVTFNGNYHKLNINDDLFLEYMIWINGTFPGDAWLSFSMFSPKYLESEELLLTAGTCGLLADGYLFQAYGLSQIVMQQVNIVDKIGAIDYTKECDRPEFRHYTTYNPVISYFGQPLVPYTSDNPCTVPFAPSIPQNPNPACVGAIDIKFDSMQVITQTSDHSKSRITMFTDEGGIIGAVMFVTWFFSIFNI